MDMDISYIFLPMTYGNRYNSNNGIVIEYFTYTLNVYKIEYLNIIVGK